MPAYKDKVKETWYVSFDYENWTGKKERKMKRGFPAKREVLEWEWIFLQQKNANLNMIFATKISSEGVYLDKQVFNAS